MKKNGKGVEDLKAKIADRKEKVQQIQYELKTALIEINHQLKLLYQEASVSLSSQQQELAYIVGFNDHVKGFDLEFVVEESIDFLDIYEEFLG